MEALLATQSPILCRTKLAFRDKTREIDGITSDNLESLHLIVLKGLQSPTALMTVKDNYTNSVVVRSTHF